MMVSCLIGNKAIQDLSNRDVLVRLEGLEPSTLGLEGRCSVQLSYRRFAGKHTHQTGWSTAIPKRVLKDALRLEWHVDTSHMQKIGRGREI